MVSSVSGSAAFSSAMLSGSQCRGSRETQALQEKLFTKLDANGDGGIDKSELGDFMSFAASASSAEAPDSTELFSSLDSDGDGAVSQTELSDGAKTLFELLRTQLMTAVSKTTETASTEKPNDEELFAKIDADGDGSINQDELGSFMEANRPPLPPPDAAPGGPGRHGGGLFSKIESLLDQYRSAASTDSSTETETSSTLSIAA